MAHILILIYLRAVASMFTALPKQAKLLYDNQAFLCGFKRACLRY